MGVSNLGLQQKIVVGVFYRQPNSSTEQVEQLEIAIEQVTHKFRNNNNITYILGGDFNTGDIDWDRAAVIPDSDQRTVKQRVLNLNQYDLTQVHRSPTLESNLLDLFFTNKPGLVKSSISIPGISDHEIVLTDCSIKPLINKQQPRRIHLWKRADWNKLKTEAVKFKESFLSLARSRSVTENFNSFKSFINQLTSKHVLTRLLRANTKHLPWITQARMCKRKQRLFSKAKRSHKSKDWLEYKNAKKETLHTIGRVHWNYINKILLEGLKERDSKPFWRYIKFRKQDSVGIAPIKQGGASHTDANMKATLLNQQFKSVFTPRNPNNQVLRLDGPSFPSLRPLIISTIGVQELLCKLNVKKASGPDNISCKILRELSCSNLYFSAICWHWHRSSGLD